MYIIHVLFHKPLSNKIFCIKSLFSIFNILYIYYITNNYILVIVLMFIPYHLFILLYINYMIMHHKYIINYI